MSKLKLTTGKIRDFSLPEGKRQVIFRDSEVPSLGVRVTTGSKSFVFQGKILGQDLRITIGDVRIWLLDNSDPVSPGARQEARRLQTLIDKGIDPRVEKAEQISRVTRAKAQEVIQETTVKTAWDDYVETHRKLWSLSHVRGHQQAVMGKRTTGPLFELMELRLAELDSDQVKAWLESNATKRPTFVANSFRKLRAFLNWCSEQKDYAEIAHVDACSTRVSKNRLPKIKPKTDCLHESPRV